MGFDKLITFFNKNVPNISEELFDLPQVVANHIYFDMNFLIYNCIYELEEEINKIIMIIYGVSYTDIDIINNKLKNIFNKYHWINLDICMNDILDGSSIDEIIKNFKNILDENIIELLGWYIYNSINHHIMTTHPINFIKTINIFYDGIPTYSKILEQRRRRMKNYLDSKNRKTIFKQYFENMTNIIITEDEIMYDYFEWINNMYSFDKSLGPYSDILIYISKFIETKMNETFKKNNNQIKIYINNSTNYGESDFKIFKHMIDNKIDCDIAIHSCDSDFIFLIIWHQLMSIVKSNSINLMLVNYNQSNKHLYYGKKIINNLIDKYSNINNIVDNVSINIIFDFLSLLILFGNDIMPPSYELGTELTLKQIFETHYILYNKNEFIVNLNSINVINFKNLGEWLKLIKNLNSFLIIILNRFYKIPYNLTINLIEKYHTFDEIIKNLPDNMLKQEKGFYIEKNSYQSLYNYIVYKATNMTEDIFNRPFKIFFDKIENAKDNYISITKNNNTNQYMNLFISLNQLFFNDFNIYSPYSILYYGDNIAPSIDMIINFINMNDMNNIQELCYKMIIKNNKIDNYFNPISHHLFITPYLIDTSNDYNTNIDIKYIDSLLNVIDYNIKGIWFKNEGIINNFTLKNINPNIFIKFTNVMIPFYQSSFIDRFFINNKLINIH